MSWDYWKFSRQPVAAEKFEMRGRNEIILLYRCRVDPKLGKDVCDICRIPCACTVYVAQLDKYWLPNIAP